MKKGYYDIRPILKKNTTYYIIFGEKSNGKSYSLKEHVLFPFFFEKGLKFVYMRRSKEEMKKADVTRYFNDIKPEWLHGMGNSVVYHASEIYIAQNENNKQKLIEKIGYAIPLSCEQKYSSQSFNDVGVIVLEEFVSRSSYIYDEINSHLMYIISTIARRRSNVKVFLLGNSISRICPYFSYFGINLNEWKQGDIKTWTIKDNEGCDISIAGEYCKPSKQEGHSIVVGSVAKTINAGEWAASPQPRLNYNYKKDELCYRILFLFDDAFNFIAEYRYSVDKEFTYWYVYPKTKRLTKKKIRIITNQFVQPDLYVSNIIVPRTDYEKRIFRELYEENFFFATDICGEEFLKLFSKLKRKFII